MRAVCVSCPCGVSQAAAATTSSRLQPGPHHRAPAPSVLARIAGGLRPAPPRLQQGQGSLSGGGCFGRCAVEPEDAEPASAPSLNTPKCARASSQNTSENDCMELLITSQITIIIVVLHSVL